MPPPSPVYENKIQVTFTSEVAGDFYLQMKNGGGWQNLLVFKNVKAGNYIDTIPYTAGLYRIVTQGDSTTIVNIK